MNSRFKSDLVNLVPKLRRFAYALTGSADLGDDLVQAACERALRYSSSYQQGTRMDSWMFRIIQNLWLDHRRRKQNQATHIDAESVSLSDGGIGAKHLDDRIELAKVREAVDMLPDDHRSVIVLIAIEGMNYRETAEILGLPLGTVMSRLSRARAKLMELVDPVETEEGEPA